MNNYSKYTPWFIIVLLVIGGLLYFRKEGRGNLAPVRLGLQTAPAVGLVKVALDKNFFQEEGITVDVKEFTAGKLALQALIGGSLDLVTPAEFPLTLAIMNGEKLSILTEINQTVGGFPMILRKEGEAFDPVIYFTKKRKIATSVGGGPEFFTADFFKKYKINSSQFEIVSMKPEDMPIALANGSLDGVAIYEPFAHFAIQQTGEDKVFSIKRDDLYSEIIVVAGKTDWIAQNRKTVEGFLRALKKAETFIKSNPEEAMDIVASFTKLDKDTLNEIWPSFTLRLGLDKKLVATMENEAQWAKDTGKVNKEVAVPNFRASLFDAPLKKIAPTASNYDHP